MTILAVTLPIHDTSQKADNDEESQPLLVTANGETSDGVPAADVQNGTTYGATGTAKQMNGTEDKQNKSAKEDKEDKIAKKERELREKLQKRLGSDGNWWTYIKGFAVFIPFIWPTKEPKLFINMAGVFAIILAQRVLNVAVPILLGKITNDLTRLDGGVWQDLAFYLVLSWISRAVLSPLRQYIWYPVEQYSYYQMCTMAYSHIMGLSMDFHQDKSTGDTYGAISQGRSVNDLMESLLFEILPMVLDLGVAFGFLYHLFGPYMALNVAVVSTAYIWVSTRFNHARKQIRRAYRDASIAEGTVAWETLSGWITVSYFNQQTYEEGRYSGVIKDHLKADLNYNILAMLIGSMQNGVYTIGLLIASTLAIYQVLYGDKDVGAFVILLTYWASLFAPLDFFSRFHRRLQSMMLDAEKLLDLIQTDPTVKDAPEAKEIGLKEAGVEFSNVKFSYDGRKTTLTNINLSAAGGTTTALVGETGGGKSTILKLLCRFYDVAEGSIKIDGQDVREVTQASLRQCIGVVPQDPSMFNMTIMANVKYARLEATDEEAIQACKDAALHDKIMGFPDGYESKVGERGVKLSGGELQRLAIARAMLKSPKILLLDEATSAVDTETERKIQATLADLTENCTTFVIAHRLSTIVSADKILVIDGGQVIEQGTHDELFEKKGRYYNLWQTQFAPVQGKGAKAGKTAIPAFVNDMGGNTRVEKQIELARQAAVKELADKENERTKAATSNGSITLAKDIPQSTKQKGKEPASAADSSWKPEAPDFIPRSLQKAAGNASHQTSSASSRPGSSGVGSSLPKEDAMATLENVKNARKAQLAKQRTERKSLDGHAGNPNTNGVEKLKAVGGDGANDQGNQP